MRRPCTPLTATGRAEVDYLMERLARHDARAERKPRLAQV
jgi:hypothetical protein